MKKIICLIIVSSVILLANAAGIFADKSPGIIVRVSVIDGKGAISLALKGKYKIYAMNSERILMEGPYLNAKVTATNEGLQVGPKDIKVQGIKVKVLRDSNIYVETRRLRGDIDIIRKENGKLLVINYIPLDDYLYGVLYNEVSHRWPMESLKAQAIAARTFALYQARHNKLQPYDLRSDIYSQVYGGRTSEKWSTTTAVNLTHNKVLTYNEDIIPAYYHATCGGKTEDASNLWNVNMLPLKGVSCDFCGQSPHYRWKKDITVWSLENDLKDNGYSVGKIASVTVLSRNISGRVDKIEIKDEAGVSVILTSKDFRQMIGPNEVRSTNFNISMKGNTVSLEGRGWGHGVGMCQWGAYGMSKKGKRSEEILKHYYPGTEIKSIDEVSAKP